MDGFSLRHLVNAKVDVAAHLGREIGAHVIFDSVLNHFLELPEHLPHLDNILHAIISLDLSHFEDYRL